MLSAGYNIPYLGKKKNLPGYQKQSREVTLMNGKRKIQQIASALKLKGHHVESADRFFKLAVQHNFVQVRTPNKICNRITRIFCCVTFVNKFFPSSQHHY